jgi:predicted nuclease of predicted toxin-antitoxin system
MRFLVDECTGAKVAEWLRAQNHEVFSVFDEARGMEDDKIIQKAFDEKWLLVTNDKDFGEKVYRKRRAHHGIILLRLADERAANKIEMLRRLLAHHADKLPNQFVVVTETQVRFAKT